MQQQIRVDLAQAAAKMAGNQAKIAQYVGSLVGRIDELVAASASEDWLGVQRVCQQLASSNRACGYRAVSAMAEQVCQEAARPDNQIAIKRSLIRLIGACGRTESSMAAAADVIP